MADKIFSIADGLHDELPSTTTAKAGRILITTDTGEMYYEPEDKKRIQVNPQADWNQNDETANDYVKNRPGGYDGSTTILPEKTLNFTSSSLSLTGCPPIEVGVIYRVTFDNTEYEFVGKESSIVSTYICIGNEKYTWGDIDTGEPFLIYNQTGDTPSIDISSSETLPCTHNIKIKAIAPVKIDEKYLDIKNTNIVNGSAIGSLRTISSSEESSEYKIGDHAFAEGSDTKASGHHSHAEGCVTKASDYASHAEGSFTTASGWASHAEGGDTTALNLCSHAEGYNTKASGNNSHAEGTGTTASGGNSHAEGRLTTASGNQSHAEGNSTNSFSSVVTATNPTNDDIITAWNSNRFSLANGDTSHVEGTDNLALGVASHAEGHNTTASGNQSHAEGSGTKASGSTSHAEGISTTASGIYSHAEGCFTTASGSSSHVEGNGTTASGGASHAEGDYTTASGNYSHAEGEGTIASGSRQHVQGKYNIADSTTYADIIGNGSSDTKRSNAYTLDWHGNAWYAGDVYVRSTSGKNKDEGSKKLATEEYVDTQIISNIDQTYSPTSENAQSGLAVAEAIAQNTYTKISKIEISVDDFSQFDTSKVYIAANDIQVKYKKTSTAEFTTIDESTIYKNSLITFSSWIDTEYSTPEFLIIVSGRIISDNFVYCNAKYQFEDEVEGERFLAYEPLYFNPSPTDLRYFATSDNPQSGKAVAEAVSAEQNRANNTFSNALKGSASGSAIIIDDISPVPHEMSVKISSDTVTDLTAVRLIKENGSGKIISEHTPNADGTVYGVTSLYPNTTLTTDTEGVIIDCEYNVDLNSTLGSINTALDSIIEIQNSLIGGK